MFYDNLHDQSLIANLRREQNHELFFTTGISGSASTSIVSNPMGLDTHTRTFADGSTEIYRGFSSPW